MYTHTGRFLLPCLVRGDNVAMCKSSKSTLIGAYLMAPLVGETAVIAAIRDFKMQTVKLLCVITLKSAPANKLRSTNEEKQL